MSFTVTTVSGQMVTTVYNNTGSQRTFSMLPYHGKTIASGGSYSFFGTPEEWFGRNKRKMDAFNAAIGRGDLVISQSPRPPQTSFHTVLGPDVVTAGDAVYYVPGSGTVNSAAVWSWASGLIKQQMGFKSGFVGIALASHTSGAFSGNPISLPVDVSPASVYTVATETGQYYVGDVMALAGNQAVVPMSGATPLVSGAFGSGTLGSGSWYVKYTWIGLGSGETQGSTESVNFTTVSGNAPRVTIDTLPSGAAWANIYLSPNGSGAGSEVLYASGITATTVVLSGTAQTSGFTPPASGQGNATAPIGLSPQKLMKTAGSGAIARVVNNTVSGATTAQVRFLSSYWGNNILGNQ